MALTWFQKVELLCGGIIFGLFNNISTIWNAKVLLQNGHRIPGFLTIFFLFDGLLLSYNTCVMKNLGKCKVNSFHPNNPSDQDENGLPG